MSMGGGGKWCQEPFYGRWGQTWGKGCQVPFSFVFDCSSGLLTQSSDQNGNPTLYDYTDPLRRLKNITYPSGGTVSGTLSCSIAKAHRSSLDRVGVHRVHQPREGKEGKGVRYPFLAGGSGRIPEWEECDGHWKGYLTPFPPWG